MFPKSFCRSFSTNFCGCVPWIALKIVLEIILEIVLNIILGNRNVLEVVPRNVLKIIFEIVLEIVPGNVLEMQCSEFCHIWCCIYYRYNYDTHHALLS